MAVRRSSRANKGSRMGAIVAALGGHHTEEDTALEPEAPQLQTVPSAPACDNQPKLVQPSAQTARNSLPQSPSSAQPTLPSPQTQAQFPQQSTPPSSAPHTGPWPVGGIYPTLPYEFQARQTLEQQIRQSYPVQIHPMMTPPLSSPTQVHQTSPQLYQQAPQVYQLAPLQVPYQQTPQASQPLPQSKGDVVDDDEDDYNSYDDSYEEEDAPIAATQKKSPKRAKATKPSPKKSPSPVIAGPVEQAETREDLQLCKLIELQQICKQRGQKVSGTKAQLIERILGIEDKKRKALTWRDGREFKRPKPSIDPLLKICFMCLDDGANSTRRLLEFQDVKICDVCYEEEHTKTDAGSLFRLKPATLTDLPHKTKRHRFYGSPYYLYNMKDLGTAAAKIHGGLYDLLFHKAGERYKKELETAEIIEKAPLLLFLTTDSTDFWLPKEIMFNIAHLMWGAAKGSL